MSRVLLAAIALTFVLPLCATEPNPSKGQRDSIDKLLAAMKVDDTIRVTLDTIYGQMEKQIVDNAAANGSSPDDIAEAKEIFAAFRARSAKLDLSGDLEEAYTRLYAKYFTEQEIDAMTVFYLSPVGRKSLDVMPQMMQEAMQAGMEHLSPKLEQAFREATEEAEKKRPWRRTTRDIRQVATAIEAYAIDNDEKYPAGDYAALEEILVPEYLHTLPEKDMWDHAYAYVASEDGQHYRLVSAGADTIFEWDSRRIVALKEGEQPAIVYRDRLEDDLIYADGEFLQLPLQAKPRDE